MNANQLTESLARAVEMAKPAQEYCIAATTDQWWTVCMTKAEWSGWMQAFFSVVAIGFSAYFALKQRRDIEADQERSRHAREEEAIRTSTLLIESASMAARQLLEVARNQGGRAEIIEPSEKLAAALRALRVIDLTTLGSHEQVAPVHESEAISAAISRHAELYFDAANISTAASGNFLFHAVDLVNALLEAENRISQLPQSPKRVRVFRSQSTYQPPTSSP